jgi:hypothetical protein
LNNLEIPFLRQMTAANLKNHSVTPTNNVSINQFFFLDM